jgi:STE24 endopeptidase
MPLFNRFTPLEDGELRAAISAYAASVEFPVRSVMVMDGSRRSTKANAFFTGFGRNKRIALFDTLIAQHGTRELVAVIAHEVGHYKKRHVLQGLVLSVVHTGVLLFLLSQFLTREGLFDAFGVTEPSVYAGLVFFGLLLTPVEAMLSVGLQALSRRHERQADAFAAETTGNPEAMVTALVTLARSTLTNLTPDPFYVLLHYSHPPLVQRVAALAARRSPET